MRNIKIVQKRISTGSIFPEEIKNDKSEALFSLGDYNNLLICRGGTIARFGLEDNQTQSTVICKNHELLGDAVQMQFVSTTGVTYLSNARGSFLQLMLHGNEVEELFQSEQGIAEFKVSPDSRFVSIVTKKNTLLLLTLPDLETITQLELEDNSNDKNSDGTTGLIVSVSIVWREDSHYFGVNCQRNDGFCIKIFDEHGALHSETEDSNPLIDSVLEWQPSGGLIASVGKTPYGTAVSLYERNGLKRADFYPYEGKNENYEDDPITSLRWNMGSDILAICYNSKVELWCRNNYVWMRKVVLAGPDTKDKTKLKFVKWDQQRSNRLHIVNDNGMYACYEVAFMYTSGYSNGSSMVVSWNGPNLHCTPFRSSCCPPPECLFQVKCETDILAVVIPEFWNGLLTISIDGVFSFWKHTDNEELKKIRSIRISDFSSLIESHDWIWPARNTVCCISDGSLVLYELKNLTLEDEKESSVEATIQLTSTNTNRLVSTALNSKEKEDNLVLIQNDLGLVFKFDVDVQDSIPVCKFPHFCYELQTIAESIVVGHDPLTRKLMLAWSKYSESEAIILSNDCTSFCVFRNCVIFTTIQGSLEGRSLTYITKLLEKHILDSEFKADEEADHRHSRKCEKGSTIVRCCLNQMLEPSLIFQIIPRGNLEIIYPRLLVISTIKVILREKENNSRFEKIMSTLRRHRIDYRVLIDEMRLLVKEESDCRLEELLKTMIEQVQNSHSLVLLVTDLNHDYSDCILAIKNILEVILNNTDKRILHVEESYLAAMAKLGMLEDALKSSLILGEREKNREIVQQRVKFLSFYCENQDILFDTALGTYDLSLASLVADCLGKDPKEYIPILDDYQSMLELKRRFKIDDKLRRYAKAVINFVRDQRVQHDEIIKYMERHRLFTDVIQFLTRKIKHGEGGVVERSGDDIGLLLREAQSSYAQYLEERGKHLEASILFRDAENHQKAIDCCIKSGNWEFGLEIAYDAEVNEERIKDLSKNILLYLEEKELYSQAARLCETYLGDLEQAVEFWIKDRKWQKAAALTFKIPALGKRFKEENIRPKLLEACNEQRETLEETMESIKSMCERLRVVKQRKAERIEEGGQGDTFSDTDSFVSGSSTSGSISSSNISGKTYRSGKNKRKMERKVYSMKEGSKYEDLAITAHLWGVIQKLQQKVIPEVSETIESLWKFYENESALSLHQTLEKTHKQANECVLEVWQSPITDEILESKFRIAPVDWNPVLTRLALHDPSSKATTSSASK